MGTFFKKNRKIVFLPPPILLGLINPDKSILLGRNQVGSGSRSRSEIFSEGRIRIRVNLTLQSEYKIAPDIRKSDNPGPVRPISTTSSTLILMMTIG